MGLRNVEALQPTKLNRRQGPLRGCRVQVDTCIDFIVGGGTYKFQRAHCKTE